MNLNLNKIKSINDELIKSQQSRSKILIDVMTFILQNPVIDTHLLQDYYEKISPKNTPDNIIEINSDPVTSTIDNTDRDRTLNLYKKRINNRDNQLITPMTNTNIGCGTCASSGLNLNKQMLTKIQAETQAKMMTNMQRNDIQQNNLVKQIKLNTPNTPNIPQFYTDTKEFKDFVILHNSIGNINIEYKIGYVTSVKISVLDNKVNYILS